MEQQNSNNDITDNSNVLNNGTVDTDIKSQTNLLNDADSVQDVQTKVLTTEVTSIANEEEKTGQKVEVGSADDLYAKAASSYIRHMKQLSDVLNAKKGNKAAIGRHGMNRVIKAILQLPQDGLPVKLENDMEMAAFGIGQRIIADRYLMTHYHIVQQQKELMAKKAQQKEEAAQAQTETVNEGDSNVSK